MSVDSRHVGRVSLRAARMQDVQSAADTLAEALRIASLPGDGRPGRLFIRHIELPALRLDRGANPIATALAERVRALKRSAIRISSPRAAKAQAVFAMDPIEPLILALLRAASGQRLVEWFWPQVDPGFRPHATPERVAARAWQLLSEEKNAAAILPAAVGAVLDAAVVGGALRAIDSNLGQTLAWRLGTPLLEPAQWSTIIERVAPASWRESVWMAIEQFGADQRAGWLVTAVAHAARPWGFVTEHGPEVAEQQTLRPVARSSEQAPPASIPADSAAATEAPTLSQAELTHKTTAEHAPHSQNVNPTQQPLLREPSAHPSAPALEPRADERAPNAPRVSDHATQRAEPLAQSRWSLFDRPAPTSYGGLLFLLHPLRRLGLNALLEQDPALLYHGAGLQLLMRFADHLQISPEDPIRRPLASSFLENDLVLPAPTWRNLLPPERVEAWSQSSDETDTFQPWMHAVSVLLAREYELSLEAVVQRAAALTCTRTHVDVIFDMNSSDVRIRKAGLDIDPGFVRWFGRVVRFHYVFGGLLDA